MYTRPRHDQQGERRAPTRTISKPLMRVYGAASAARGGRGERLAVRPPRAARERSEVPARRRRPAREVGAGYQRSARLPRLRGIPLVHRRDTQSIPAGADRRARWPVWHRRAGPRIRVARASLRGCPCPCAAAMGPPAHLTRFERPCGTLGPQSSGNEVIARWRRLAVRANLQVTTSSEEGEHMRGTMVCSVTDTEEGRGALQLAVELSGRLGLRLVLAHVSRGIGLDRRRR